jgi:hypothetical protein
MPGTIPDRQNPTVLVNLGSNRIVQGRFPPGSFRCAFETGDPQNKCREKKEASHVFSNSVQK